MGKSSSGGESASYQEYPRPLVPDPRSCLNSQIIILESDGTRNHAFSDGLTWRTGGGISNSQGLALRAFIGSAPFNTTLLYEALRLAAQIRAFGSSSPDTQVGTSRFPWKASTKYAANAIRVNLGSVYQVSIGGISAPSGGPTGTGQTIVDGGVTWAYLSADADQWLPNTVYSVVGTFVNNQNQLYRLTVAGTSASSGGPTANSGAVIDNGCTWARVQQFFCDTVFGDDLNSSGAGQTPNTPTKSINTTLGTNVKYWIAAGSNFLVDALAVTGTFIGTQPGLCVTVYDRTTGNEIRNHPNPFDRRMRGGWLTDLERTTKYFTIQGDFNGRNYASVSRRSGVTGSLSGSLPILRGAYITGCFFGLQLQSTATWRVEDCAFENNGVVNDLSSGAYGGANLRVENSGVAHSFARLFIRAEGVGEDSIWMSNATQPTNWTLSDVVVYHAPKQKTNSGHADGLQAGKYPGFASMTRCIIEHVMPETDVINDAAAGADPVGAALIMDGSGNSTASLLTLVDCIFASNLLAFNFQALNCEQFRVVAYVSKLARAQPAYVAAYLQQPTQTECVNKLANSNSDIDRENFYLAPIARAASGPRAFTARALTQIDNTAVFTMATAQAATINAGLPSGFGCTWSGAGALTTTGTATVTDKRTTGASNPYAVLIQTGTDTYDLIGGKA